MSRKLHIAFPACFLLVATLLIGYFGMVGFSVGDSTASNVPAETIVSSQEISTLNVNAPITAVQTNVSQESADTVEAYVYTGDSGYELTDRERIAVECAVMCEAGGEGERGQMMVAQSILDGSLRNDFGVEMTISEYKIHSTSYSNVTEEVQESVAKVFDEGIRVTEEKTDLWYNPALVKSEWHEEQTYVITVGSHRFFWMNNDMYYWMNEH